MDYTEKFERLTQHLAALGPGNTRLRQHTAPATLRPGNTRQCSMCNKFWSKTLKNFLCKFPNMHIYKVWITKKNLNVLLSTWQHSAPATLGSGNTRPRQHSAPVTLGSGNTRPRQHYAPVTLGNVPCAISFEVKHSKISSVSFRICILIKYGLHRKIWTSYLAPGSTRPRQHSAPATLGPGNTTPR